MAAEKENDITANREHGYSSSPAAEKDGYMNDLTQQNVFCGDWLQLESSPGAGRGSKILLRKEFSLDNIISYADLWICAIPGYHLYINGFHVGYGQAASTMQECTGDHYSIAQYLDVGFNVIAVECFIHPSTTYFATDCQGLFWCQMDLNNVPVLWSNPYWKMLNTNCTNPCSAVRHAGLGKTIQLDLAKIPENWQEPGFDDSSWANPVSRGAVMEQLPRMKILETEQLIWTETEIPAPVAGGLFKDEMLSTSVTYGHLSDFTGGVYVAETFVYSEKEQDTDLVISSDDPYVIFCNDISVFRSDVRTTVSAKVENTLSFKPGDSLLQSAVLHLNSGWNRLFLVQDTVKNSMGLFLLFPGMKKGELIFCRKPEEHTEKGWNLMAAFDLPFAYATASISSLDRESTTGHIPGNPAEINDVSTFLHSCTFYPYNIFNKEGTLPISEGDYIYPPRETAADRNILREGEYIVYDLEKTRYGFPCFEFEGSSGDIVDITPGIHFAENRIRSVGPMGRKSDSLLLTGRADRKDLWWKFEPVGARYIMVTARKCRDTVAVSCSFQSCDVDRDMDLGFQCSDPVLETLWQQTILAGEQCVKNNLIDNPAGKCCQSLVESYIYSRSLYSFFGVIPPVSNALQQFARAQLSNGMIPGIVPSGIFTFAPDSTLVWVLWLKEHFMADGNLDFLRSMLGVLHKLLDLFGISSAEHNGLLSCSVFGRTEFLNEAGNMEEEGIFTALNALYCRALICAGDLFHACGEEERAATCRMRAEFIAKAMQMLTFNEENSLFADHSLNQKRSENHSVEANILALYGGIVPGEAQQKILDFILENVKRDPARFTNSRILGFLLDTLFAFSKQEEALDFIRASVEYNKTFENTPTYENLLIFPLTAGLSLIREVLGLRPAEPGMKKHFFNPPCFCLQHAKGKVTNKNEQILVEWELLENKKLKVKADSNFPLEIVPVLPEKIAECTFKLGPSVNIRQSIEK